MRLLIQRYMSLIGQFFTIGAEAVSTTFFGHSVIMTGPLRAYLNDSLCTETPAELKLRQLAEKQGGDVAAHADASQAAFLAWILRWRKVSRVLEIGTRTGYNTLILANAVGADGKVVTLDASEDLAKIGMPFWEQDGVAERIEFRSGNVADTLAILQATGELPFELIVLDASRPGYLKELERVRAFAKADTIIAVDNTLWQGNLINRMLSKDVMGTLRGLNDQIFGAKGKHPPPGFDPAILPSWGGFTLLRVTE